MKEWINTGKGFGFYFTSTALEWVWWKPGTKTEEGELAWGEQTLGVVPWKEGQPKHYHRADGEILNDLLNAEIIEGLKAEIQRRTRKPIASPEIPHQKQAYLLGQSGLGSPGSIVGFFRHHCSSYDSELNNGGDRVTATLRVHNELLEIMQFFQENKQHFLQKHQPNLKYPGLEHWERRLALLDHDAIVSLVLAENEKRRVDTPGQKGVRSR